MSSFVSVWLTEWTVNPRAVGLDRGDRVADRHQVTIDQGLVAGDPPDDPDRRSGRATRARPAAARSPDPGPRRRPGRSRRSSVTVRPLSRVTMPADEGLIGRVRDVEARVGDDDQDVLGRGGVPAGAEDGVRLGRLGLGLVRVAVRVVGLDAADRLAQHEQADRARGTSRRTRASGGASSTSRCERSRAHGTG